MEAKGASAWRPAKPRNRAVSTALRSYAAFATNFLDLDNDPGFLGVPASAAGFRHELPNRYLLYSE